MYVCMYIYMDIIYDIWQAQYRKSFVFCLCEMCFCWLYFIWNSRDSTRKVLLSGGVSLFKGPWWFGIQTIPSNIVLLCSVQQQAINSIGIWLIQIWFVYSEGMIWSHHAESAEYQLENLKPKDANQQLKVSTVDRVAVLESNLGRMVNAPQRLSLGKTVADSYLGLYWRCVYT